MPLNGISNKAFQNDSEVDEPNKNISLTKIKYKNEEFSGQTVLPTQTSTEAETNSEPKSPEDGPEEGREEWSNQCEFILSTVGYAVGLGNVWRFPYLAYKNGGGSFLIPYCIMLFFAGLPLFFMELVLGQYSRQGPTKVFGRIAPVFKGLGLAMLGATFFVGIYYNMIIGWTLFYMFSGFTSELPWVGCTPNVSSIHCISTDLNLNIPTDLNLNISTNNVTEFDLYLSTYTNQLNKDNSTNLPYNSTTRLLNQKDPYAVAPPEDFFLHQMLGLDKQINNWDNVGGVRWQMALCLLGAWVIVCLCLINGVQSSGKVNLTFSLFITVIIKENNLL